MTETHSKHTFTTLLADPDNEAESLGTCVAGFSESARDIVAKFNFDTQIDRLEDRIELVDGHVAEPRVQHRGDVGQGVGRALGSEQRGSAGGFRWPWGSGRCWRSGRP